MDNAVKIGVGLGFIWIAIRVAINNLVVGVQKVLLAGLNIEQGIVQLQVNVSIKNPLPIGVTVKDVVGDVYLQGVKVGVVKTAFDYYLGGSKVHVLPVIVTLTASGVGQALWKNIQTGDVKNLVIDFDGKIKVTDVNIGVPLQFSLKWEDIV